MKKDQIKKIMKESKTEVAKRGSYEEGIVAYGLATDRVMTKLFAQGSQAPELGAQWLEAVHRAVHYRRLAIGGWLAALVVSIGWIVTLLVAFKEVL